MSLVNLPTDILVALPSYLHNIEDFMNASSSCRTLRNSFTNTHPNTILRLAAAQSRIFFRPDPYFLVAATARQLGNWALQSRGNTETLREAFRGGLDGSIDSGIGSLLELSIAKTGLTMDDIRRIHASRFQTINPAADMIDRLAGEQWYSADNFWEGGVSEAATIRCEPARSLFQFVIYGELFGSTMGAFLQPEKNLPRFDIDLRLDYIRYCIPDYMCQKGYLCMNGPQEVGPYALREDGGYQFLGDQVAMQHILNCGRWTRPWDSVRREIGPDFEEEWRQKMWHSSVEIQGLPGLELLRPGGVETWKGRLTEIRSQIERLDENNRPKVFKFGLYENLAYDYPNMADEVFVCMAGYWQT
jgi:hypothetical protein